MSSIDLVILGIVLEKSQSAYEIQKRCGISSFVKVDKDKRSLYI